MDGTLSWRAFNFTIVNMFIAYSMLITHNNFPNHIQDYYAEHFRNY